LVIGGIRWSGDVAREAQYRRETLTLVARVAAGRAESLLGSTPAILDLISTGVAGNPCDLPMREILDALPEFASFGVVGPRGIIRCSTQAGAVGSDVNARDWFRAVRDDPQPFVLSGAVFGQVTHQWVVASALRRETSTGDFDGAFVLGLPVNVLVAQLEHSDLPRDYEVALVDDTGRVFASSFWEMIGGADMAKINPREGGFLDLKTNTGESRQAAIIPLAGREFYAMVSGPTPPPIALENLAAFGNFALPLMAWFLALVTAWLAMDRLVLRWLDYLGRIAGLYASGKLSVQPLRARRQAPVEINALADTLEEMAIRIRDRTNHMESALATRDAAMKEIHHRVKNNLQIINSLLSLQGRKLEDPAAKAVLDDARTRISALSLVHASLYEYNDIRAVETKSFFTKLAANLAQALGAEDLGIHLIAKIDPDTIDADVAVPLALFTAEAITNSVKHGFPEMTAVEDGRIELSYRVLPDETILLIEDNGAGDGKVSRAHAGLGGTLMKAFAKQAKGVLDDGAVEGGGWFIRIRIPASERSVPKAEPEIGSDRDSVVVE
jgi:two-component sensor histidine kinase